MTYWAIFIGIIVLLLAFDLGILHKKNKSIGIKASLWLSLFYFLCACLFGLFITFYMGIESGKEYFAGFLVEKTLSIDNIFVISMIFQYLSIPRKYHHRILFWGIIGAIISRIILIGLGATIVAKFSWVMLLFGAFLCYTAVKMIISFNQKMSLEDNFILKFIRKHPEFMTDIQGDKFLIKDEKDKKLKMTPLFIALCMVESMDIIFAVDSVPAIFAITHDPFIVYTSNIFAILGLRALYFALEAIIAKFKYLKYSAAIILLFVGIKIYVAELYMPIPTLISLSIIITIITAGIIVSIMKRSSLRGNA